MLGCGELAVICRAAITPRGAGRVEPTSHHWGHLLSNPTLFALLGCDCCGFGRKWTQPCQLRGASCQEFPARPQLRLFISPWTHSASREKNLCSSGSTYFVCILCCLCITELSSAASNLWTPVHALVVPNWQGSGVSGSLIHRTCKSFMLLRPRVYWLEFNNLNTCNLVWEGPSTWPYN